MPVCLSACGTLRHTLLARRAPVAGQQRVFALQFHALCHRIHRRCTSRPTSEAFHAAISSPDKYLNVVPGGYHEVLFSSDVSAGLVQGMIDWIKQRAAAGASAAKM